MSHFQLNLPVMFSAVFLALSSFAPAALFANTENESGPLAHLDGYNGITLTVAAGAAVAANDYRFRRKLEAARAEKTHSAVVLKGSGATLMVAPGDSVVDLALNGARHGDVVSIEYIPGNLDELNQAVSDLKASEMAWERRIAVLTKELNAIDRRRTVARHQLAELPLKEKSRDARERAQTRLEAAEKEYAHVKASELDAQRRMHHARGQWAAEKLNFESSLRALEAADAAGKNAHFKVITNVVYRDFPVDDSTRNQLAAFADRVTASKTLPQAKKDVPHLRITRVNMPDYDGAMKLLNASKRGLWGVGLGVMVALEEVTTGYLADGLRESLEPSTVVPVRNSTTAR
jgi:hypothetical protein